MDQTDTADWLALALQRVAVKQPSFYLTSKTAAPPGMQRRPEKLIEHPKWRLHVNLTPELCISLAGKPILALRDHICAPRLAVIGSRVMHCEARMPRSAAFSLLWIFPAKTSAGFAVSKYDPRQGWDVAWRYSLFDESVTAFRKALDRLIETSEGLEIVRAELMVMLASAHRDLVTHEGQSLISGQKIAMLKHVKDYLDTNLDKAVSLKQVASMSQLSPNYLNSLFHEWQGKGIHAYLIERRMEQAMKLCRNSKMAMKEIAATVGFNDPLYFSRAFHKYHGTWPSRFRLAKPPGMSKIRTKPGVSARSTSNRHLP